MSENFREKFAAFGGKIVEGGAEASRKMGQRMKELFQASSSQADKLVEDATSEKNGWSVDWNKNLQICDMVNGEGISCQEVVRSVKKRLIGKGAAVQHLALILLETCVKNCDKMFAEVASEKVLDELVRIVDDQQTNPENRDKVLRMIESWGEATEELRYLPVFEETYKSLRSRGIRFPGRDEESLAPIFTPQSVPVRSNGTAAPTMDRKQVFDLARNSSELLTTVLSSSPQKEVLEDDVTTALVEQCRQSQTSVQRLIESSGENEALMFEGLQVNDELQRVLQKFEELFVAAPQADQQQSVPAAFVVAAEEDDGGDHESLVRSRFKQQQPPPDQSIDKLDEMIFGKGGSSGRPSKTVHF